MTTRAQQRSSIRVRLGATALTCAVALVVGPSTGVAAAQSGLKPCAQVVHNSMPGGARSVDVRARGVSCATVRRLIKQERNRFFCIREGVRRSSCKVKSFTCRSPTKYVPRRLTDCRRPGARFVFVSVGGS